MANVIKLKKSIVAGNIPTTANLALGEGAVNHTDQKIYFRHPGTGVVWNFAGGSITTGPVDNSILRADGTSGATLQNSGLIVEDTIVSITGITGDALTDVITATGSAFANGQPVRFTALTGGTGLNTTTNYFVRDVSGATFKLETSIGGGAINFTTNITAGTLLTGHSVSTNVTLSENTTATNSDLVLTPKGTGAFILGPKPDGTTEGGNIRGIGAVDLQLVKNAASNVASGIYSFIAGSRSTASAQESTAIGRECLSSATNATTIGNRVQATALSATALGHGSVSDRFGMLSHGSDRFAAAGDAQHAQFVMRCKTTTNTGVEMALNGATTRLTIPSGKYLTGTINIAGIKSDGSATASYIRHF